MATSEEHKKKEQGKGFAGLSSLVSDVDATPPPAPKKTSTSSTGTAPQPAPQQPYKPPQQPGSGSSVGKWMLGIAIGIGMLWLVGQSNKNTSPPTPAYSPTAQSASPGYSAPNAQPQAPSRPVESKPPVGQGLTLPSEQIAYCVAEDIRLDGAKSAVNSYSNSDVDRFNAMVADYNSRCGSFRYRKGALENARRDIEAIRGLLQADGRSRFQRNPTTQTPKRQDANGIVWDKTSPVSVTSVVLGTAVGSDQMIVSATTSFGAYETIYASVSTAGAATSAKLKAKWSFQDGQIVNVSSQIIAPTGPAVTSFHISKPDGWPAGRYKVEISLDNQPVSSKDFVVKYRR